MSQKYSVPDDLRVYAIGDIHGYVDVLKKMHAEIAEDLNRNPAENSHIIYIGDYIDRGPDSAGVLNELVEHNQLEDQNKRTFLLGNHEVALLDFLEGSPVPGWIEVWGGRETLTSHGITFDNEIPLPSEIETARTQLQKTIPAAHVKFLKNLALSEEIGDYFFAHAGVNPERPLKQQTPDDLIRMRQPFLSWDKPLEKCIVHGHTVSKEPVIKPHRIGIYTGLYKGGPLTCAVFEGSDVRFLQITA